MRRFLLPALLLAPLFAVPAAPVVAQAPPAQDARDAIKASYTKHEYMIPMRDGVELYTAVYVPKDDSQTYPVLLMRTPYGVGPYGADQYPARLGPSAHFRKAGYIFADQDVRGRMKSGGKFAHARPHNPAKAGKETDESATPTTPSSGCSRT
jgi:predicted acyl esterase